MRARRLVLIAAAGAALAAVGAVVALAAGGTGSWTAGWGMMGGRYVFRPAQPTRVSTLAEARSNAQQFADRLGLHVTDVVRFQRNFYAELAESSGSGGTEVLIDPSSGVVSIEYGPAMMWNSEYGMGRSAGSMMGSYGQGMMGAARGGPASSDAPGPSMMGGSGYGPGMMDGGNGTNAAGSVSMTDAHALAQRWLDRNEPGVTVEAGGDAFPGYYTLETLKAGKIMGMISVNASTGAVWPHWWHGAFIAKFG